MKKEELVKYIDDIQPDLYMETRLKAKIADSKKSKVKPRTLISSVTALCIVAALVVGTGFYGKVQNNADGGKDNTIVNGIVPDIMDAFIIVASAGDYQGAATVAAKPLEVNEAYPYGVHMKLCDVTGMSESEKKNLVNEMSAELKKYINEDGFTMGGSTVITTDKVYMVICSVNEFRFVIQQDKTLKSINVKNTSPYGQMVYSSGKREFSAPLHGDDITVNGEEFDPTTAGFYWDYTDELISAFEENPETSFSTFNDVITFTLEYTDGSKSVGVVELNFDTYGNAAAVCKKYANQKAGSK